MKIHSRPLPGVVLSLAAALGAATAASAGTAATASELDGIAIDAAGVTSPWMLEQLPDGRIELKWGAIQRELSSPTGFILQSGGTTPAALAAARVQCGVTVGNITRSPNLLISSLKVSCTPGFSYISSQSYFQYKQLLLWFRYSVTRNFGPTTTSPETETPAVRCRVGAGNHQYRQRARGFSPSIGWSPWYSGNASGTNNCGASEP